MTEDIILYPYITHDELHLEKVLEMVVQLKIIYLFLKNAMKKNFSSVQFFKTRFTFSKVFSEITSISYARILTRNVVSIRARGHTFFGRV